MNNRPLVLVADPDPRIRTLLQRSLTGEGFLAFLAKSSEQALDATFSRRPDIAILGVGLPGMALLDLIGQLRASHDMPIIVLSERSDGVTVGDSLDAGADDFVFKPLPLAETLARVRAVLRRAQARQCRPAVVIGEVAVDLARRSVSRRGREIPVNRTEYLVIQQLVLHAGRVVTHAALLTAVWGAEYRDEVTRIRYWIARVRRKLGIAPGEDGPLITYPGVGYALDPEGVLRAAEPRREEELQGEGAGSMGAPEGPATTIPGKRAHDLLDAWRLAERRRMAAGVDQAAARAAGIEVVKAWLAYHEALGGGNGSEVVLITDDQRRYVAMTPNVQTLLGYQPEELCGRQVDDLASGELAESTPARWQDFVGATRDVGTFSLVAKDGHAVAVEYDARSDYPVPGFHVSRLRPQGPAAPGRLATSATAR